MPSYLPNVAFQRPDGKKVLIVLNTSGAMKSFNLKYKEKFVSLTLESGAAGTYIW
jgi:glucosylceramidase